MRYTPDFLRSCGIDPDGMIFHGGLPPYRPELIPLARELRVDGTKAEAKLWKVLSHSKTGYRFERQRPILNYIADFYCQELGVVVEVDGSTHFSAEDHAADLLRDEKMSRIGLKVVRLLDSNVKRNPVVEAQRIFFELGMDVPEL